MIPRAANDNLIQIAHNVIVGEGTVIAAQTGIAGSTTIGARSMIGGQAGIGGHLTLAAGIKSRPNRAFPPACFTKAKRTRILVPVKQFQKPHCVAPPHPHPLEREIGGPDAILEQDDGSKTNRPPIRRGDVGLQP